MHDELRERLALARERKRELAEARKAENPNPDHFEELRGKKKLSIVNAEKPRGNHSAEHLDRMRDKRLQKIDERRKRMVEAAEVVITYAERVAARIDRIDELPPDLRDLVFAAYRLSIVMREGKRSSKGDESTEPTPKRKRKPKG